jgi:uncharacterized membrane protein
MATVPEQHAQRDQRVEPERNERSLASLLKELRDEATTLMREELTLAKTEISDKISRVGRNVGYVAGGGLVAFAGLIVLLLAIAAGIYVGLLAMDVAASIAIWLAPLIVGVVVIAIGYAMLQKAIHTLQEEPVMPQRTVKTVQDDTNWIKEKVSR